MNLKQQRKEFYKLIEHLLKVKIPDDKVGYISDAIKSYAKSTNEKYQEKVEILENKLEKIKDIKFEKQISKKSNKEKPDTIRVWRAK